MTATSWAALRRLERRLERQAASARRATVGRKRGLCSRSLAALCVLLSGFGLPRAAAAWECSRVLDNSGTPNGAALSWPMRQIPFAFSTTGTTALDNEVARATVRQAFATWQTSVLRNGNTTCFGLDDGVPEGTDLVFLEDAPQTQDFAGYNFFDPDNNHSMILFRDTSWPYPMTTVDRTERMALTTVTFNRDDGTIVDADIEFNSFGYAFTVGDSNVAWDLLNIATHEVGHFLGLAHSKVVDATMFNLASFGEVQKRTLSCDDATALWFRYPLGQPTRLCGAGNLNDRCGNCAPAVPLTFRPTSNISRTDGGKGGCSCTHVGGGDWGLFSLAAICLFRRRRRAAR